MSAKLVDKQYKRMYDGANEVYMHVREDYDYNKLAREFAGDDIINHANSNTERFQGFVMNIARRYVPKAKACYRYYGALKAVLEILGIESKFIIGIACETQSEVNKIERVKQDIPPNYCWVEGRGGVYRVIGDKISQLIFGRVMILGTV